MFYLLVSTQIGKYFKFVKSPFYLEISLSTWGWGVKNSFMLHRELLKIIKQGLKINSLIYLILDTQLQYSISALLKSEDRFKVNKCKNL